MAIINSSSRGQTVNAPQRKPFDAAEANRFKALALTHCADLLDALFDSAQLKLPDWDERDADFNGPPLPSAAEVLRFLQQERTLISRCFIEEFGHALSFGNTSDGGVFTPGEFTGDAPEFPEDEAELDRRISIMARKADFRYCDNMTRCLTQLDLAIGSNKHLEITPEGMAPAHACNAFRLALLAANTPDDIEQRLFKLFEHEVLGGLGRCYDMLSAHLKQLGYQPPKGSGDTSWSNAQAAEKPIEREHAVANPDINPAPVTIAAGTTSTDSLIVTRFLETLAGELRDDLGISAVTRSLLSRFYPPALQCALRDGDILGRVEHPVRRLFCELALIDLLDARHAKHGHRIASQLLEQLGARPNRTQIAEALRDLETALAAHSGSQDNPRRAARRAALELNQQACGLEMNNDTRRFLSECWVPLLQATARAGATSEAFLSVRNHGQSIIQSLRRIVVGGQDTTEVREELIKSTDRKLRLLKLKQEQREKIIDQLTRLCAPAKAIDNSPYCEEEAQLLDELAAWTPAPAEAPAAAADAVLDTRARKLLDRLCKPDVWFRIYAGPDSSARWRKLTQYDRENQRVYFGDRNGENAIDVAAAEFALDLMAGRSRPVYDSDKFSQNLSSIIHGHSLTLDDPE